MSNNTKINKKNKEKIPLKELIKNNKGIMSLNM